MQANKVIAVVEKIARSKVWLVADDRKFYLPVELWPNAKVGEKIIFDAKIETENSPQKMLESIIN